jgi:hypothetical protein
LPEFGWLCEHMAFSTHTRTHMATTAPAKLSNNLKGMKFMQRSRLQTAHIPTADDDHSLRQVPSKWAAQAAPAYALALTGIPPCC